jgi:signal transduction histidine kinase
MVPQPDEEDTRMTCEAMVARAPAAVPPPARHRSHASWFGWAVLPLYVSAAAAYILLDRALDGPALERGQGPLVLAAFTMTAAMGALLVVQRPGNAVGWVLSGASLLLAAGAAGDTYAAWVMTVRGRPDALALAGALLQQWYWLVVVYLVLALLPLLFPDGRLPSPRWWWRVPAATGLAGAATFALFGSLTDVLSGQDVDYRIDNPIGSPGLSGGEGHPVFAVAGALVVVGMLTGLAAVVVRVRRSRGNERQQMKWFLVAAAPMAAVPLVEQLPEPAGAIWFGWIVLSLPVAVAIAVLRHRLDGIDVVINRALVYGALTALVVGVYVLVVGYLGALIRREDELLVSLVATGLVAVLFAPARDRLQRAVDRLLYGHRAEPYAALSRLGERLEGTLAPDAVLPTIVSTVREALRLPYAAISTDDDGAERVVATAGEPVAATERLPLLYQNARVGALTLGLRPGEDGFSPADRRLLSDLARQAGVAVSAVRLTADLQRSRERLVSTREEERRRLRRDLHDGLGAQLAALTVQAGVLRKLIPTDPAAADALAGELREELRAAIADIRRLVHGLRPPALDELGLTGALQRLAERSGTDGTGPRVTVEVDGDLPGLPAAVEVAAYRIAQEALTNAGRHSGATTCSARLTVEGTDLLLEIADDGAGLPAAGLIPGVGLSSMRERAAEMGGECLVDSVTAGGVRVRARLPLAGGS